MININNKKLESNIEKHTSNKEMNINFHDFFQKQRIKELVAQFEDYLNGFEEINGDQKAANNIREIVKKLRSVERNAAVNTEIPHKLSNVCEYPLIGLLMKKSSENSIESFNPLLKSFSIDLSQINHKLRLIHKLGKKILEHGVYGDMDAAYDFFHHVNIVTELLGDKCLIPLFDCYACIGKDVMETDSWEFFKAFVLIHINDFKDIDPVLELFELNDELSIDEIVKYGHELMQNNYSYWKIKYFGHTL